MQQYPNPQISYSQQGLAAEYIKQNEKHILRRKSSGIGFFIFFYSIMMEVIAFFIKMIFEYSGINLYQNYFAENLFYIASSVGAAFITGMIYLAASRYKLRESFRKTYVSPTLLIPLIFIGMAVAMAANYATFLFDSNFSIFGLENQAGTETLGFYSTPEIILYILSTAIVPAFAEEFAFRGIIMGSLRKYGNSFALLMSSVMFASMHANTSQIVFAFILGLILGYIDIVADSIIPSVILHFLNNFYAVLMDVFYSNSDLDNSASYIIQTALIILFCFAGLLSFIYLSLKDKNSFRISSKEKSEYTYSDVLSYKEKIGAFFINPGIIISLCYLLATTIYNLIPRYLLL